MCGTAPETSAATPGEASLRRRLTRLRRVTSVDDAGRSAPITGLSHVQLLVSDVGASAKWYSAVLGLAPFADDPDIGYVALQHKGCKVRRGAHQGAGATRRARRAGFRRPRPSGARRARRRPTRGLGRSTSLRSASTTPAWCWKAVTLRSSCSTPTASPSNWWRPKLFSSHSVNLRTIDLRGFPAAGSWAASARLARSHAMRASASVKDDLLVGLHDVEVDGATVGRDRELDLAVDDEAPERSRTRRGPRLEAPSRPESEQLLEIVRRQASARVHAQLHMFRARDPRERLSVERPNVRVPGHSRPVRRRRYADDVRFTGTSDPRRDPNGLSFDARSRSRLRWDRGSHLRQ